jgi:hypothetical protein
MLAEISARMDENAKMDTNQAEMRSTVCAILSELEETIQLEMRAQYNPYSQRWMRRPPAIKQQRQNLIQE